MEPEPKKINSISELHKMGKDSRVSLDGIVEEVKKENGVLVLRVGDVVDYDGKLKCWALGGALLAIDAKPGDTVTVTGKYHPSKDPFNEFLELIHCEYKNQY